MGERPIDWKAEADKIEQERIRGGRYNRPAKAGAAPSTKRDAIDEDYPLAKKVFVYLSAKSTPNALKLVALAGKEKRLVHEAVRGVLADAIRDPVFQPHANFFKKEIQSAPLTIGTKVSTHEEFAEHIIGRVEAAQKRLATTAEKKIETLKMKKPILRKSKMEK